MSDKVTFKRGTEKQTITFHALSDDMELALHEIIVRVFRKMTPMQITAEIGWLRAKYID